MLDQATYEKTLAALRQQRDAGAIDHNTLMTLATGAFLAAVDLKPDTRPAPRGSRRRTL